MKGLQTRQYLESDYLNVIKLWQDVGLILSYSDNKDEFNRFAEFNPNSFFLLFDKEQLVGTVIGSRDGRRGFIHHLAIAKSHQGHGLGNELMEIAEEHFFQEKIVKIHLMIEKTNKEVVNFYEKSGWHVRNDLILMSKSLIDGKFQP